MAKASKKSETKSTGAKAEAKPKAAAKAPAAKAKAPAAKKQQASSGAAPQAPMIDTNLAASAAAAMILNRAATTPAAPSAQPAAKKESSAFKHLKDSLSKPASAALGGTFGNIAGQKKSNLPLGGGKQVGRNQTFGADVNRAGVPRRTGGG